MFKVDNVVVVLEKQPIELSFDQFRFSSRFPSKNCQDKEKEKEKEALTHSIKSTN